MKAWKLFDKRKMNKTGTVRVFKGFLILRKSFRLARKYLEQRNNFVLSMCSANYLGQDCVKRVSFLP
jgi:hypothetical protein